MTTNTDRLVDLGGAHAYRLFTVEDGNGDNVPGGVHIFHPAHDGAACRNHATALGAPSEHLGVGSVMFDIPATARFKTARWLVRSWSPLTIEPSIKCGACGDHGFIRDGRWEPA